MILDLDEGYCFDFLSILRVKLDKDNDDKNLINYNKHYDKIKEQLDCRLFNDIITSKEYKDLIDINSKLYELVDLAKKNLVMASEVDNYVFKRYLAKVALQDKFFTNKLSEVKIGY